MNNKYDQGQTDSILCWNIGNPSLQRASKQAEWIRKRSDKLIILTETKDSEGCNFIEKYLKAFGFSIIFPRPERNEYGVMIISKHPVQKSSFSTSVNFLSSRVVSIKGNLADREVELIGIYVPSRDSSIEKIGKKKTFLNNVKDAFEKCDSNNYRIFCGDLNILEPNHFPHYSIFEEWEYAFYRDLINHNLKDAFRYIQPTKNEYSWVGRTNEGYRYDHIFISENMIPQLEDCYYLHEPREMKLSDHSAIVGIFKTINRKCG